MQSQCGFKLAHALYGLQARCWQSTATGRGLVSASSTIIAITRPFYSSSISGFTYCEMPDDAERAAPQNVQPAEAKQLLDKEYTLLDVR